MTTALAEWRPRLEALLLGPALWGAAGEDGAHDLCHVRRVVAMALRLAQADPTADALVVLAAATLHDCVNVAKDDARRAQASQLAATAAVDALAGAGFPPNLLPGVAHAIAAHSFSANIAPQTVEARIVQDADRLEALGAIGAARAFYVAGLMRTALLHADDPLAAGRPLDDRAYALDHFEKKLFQVAKTMQTAEGQRVAADRVAFLQHMRQRLADEALGLA
jgi:uncharacterized protein